jgi:hypothetical protein
MAQRPLDLLISVEPKGHRWVWKLSEEGYRLPVRTGTAATKDDAFADAQQARWTLVDEAASKLSTNPRTATLRPGRGLGHPPRRRVDDDVAADGPGLQGAPTTDAEG